MTTATAMSVLVVEDSPDQAQLLSFHLQGAGCHVSVAESAEDAIIAYGARAFDLAFVDLRLPGMDGWELVQHMQRDRPELAIAVTSVLDRKDYPDVPWSLPKPFTGAQVRHLLDACSRGAP